MAVRGGRVCFIVGRLVGSVSRVGLMVGLGWSRALPCGATFRPSVKPSVLGQVCTVAPGGGAAGGGGSGRGGGCMLACWDKVIKCGCAVHVVVDLLRRACCVRSACNAVSQDRVYMLRALCRLWPVVCVRGVRG
jgi:hypothetical protein